MTQDKDALAALAALADARGIEREFRDYRNERVVTPLEVRSHILELMGVDLSPDRVANTLAELRRARAAQPLPASIVMTEGAPLALTLQLPESMYRAELALQLDCEDGSQMRIQIGAHAEVAPPSPALAGVAIEERSFSLLCPLPIGYHSATLCGPEGETLAGTRIIVTPQRAYRPRAVEEGRKLFGFSVQLYSVRSSRNWGMGDLTDLAELIRLCAAQGADMLGVNPLHALFPAKPLQFSPYSPSHRSFLNVMYIDPLAVPEYPNCEEARAMLAASDFQERLHLLREAHDVDYAAVASCKLQVMEMLYAHFIDRELGNDTRRAASFRDFVATQGQALRRHALYDSLQEHFMRLDPESEGWSSWPVEFQDCAGIAVEGFAETHADRIQYFQYLQWCAHEQLRAAQSLAESLRMQVGIYLDIAVGADRDGSEVWSNRRDFATQASAGAPPDELARTGQDWGFPPLCPEHLQRSGYELFIRNLRANMALCGAVRYDHAVSLLRLWWVPRQGSAAQGAYVRYPLDALLGLLALESQRQRCLVIGEDLGTVPAALTEQMQARHIYSYKVLYFEKTYDRMKAPRDYPEEAAATVTTHDLATLASWWEGSDIDLRADLGLLGGAAVAEQMRETRVVDRRKLLLSLRDADCWNDSVDPAAYPRLTRHLNAAIHYFLARSSAALMLTQLEELMAMHSPVNVPGTFREYANWQRKLRFPLEELFDRDEPAAICAAMREGRRS